MGSTASVSNITPPIEQGDTSSVGPVADVPLVASTTWDITSPSDRESLHITPEYYDGYQKAGFMELANTIQQYDVPGINDVYKEFLSSNEGWFSSVPKGIDGLASQLIENEQFIEDHLSSVPTTTSTSYAFEQPSITTPRDLEDIRKDRLKLAKEFLNQNMYDASANIMKLNMPDRIKGDEEALEYMEQYMLENYRSMIDVSGDGRVGNTPVLKFDGFETWRSGDMMGITPKFSGYLADKFEAAGIDIINSVYNFFGGSAKNVSERREQAEKN